MKVQSTGTPENVNATVQKQPNAIPSMRFMTKTLALSACHNIATSPKSMTSDATACVQTHRIPTRFHSIMDMTITLANLSALDQWTATALLIQTMCSTTPFVTTSVQEIQECLQVNTTHSMHIFVTTSALDQWTEATLLIQTTSSMRKFVITSAQDQVVPHLAHTTHLMR